MYDWSERLASEKTALGLVSLWLSEREPVSFVLLLIFLKQLEEHLLILLKYLLLGLI